MKRLNRRELLKVAGGVALARSAAAAPKTVQLFDGKTLHGWTQIENSSMSAPSGDVVDAAGFAGKVTNGTDELSVYLRGRMGDAVKADLAKYSASDANAKAVVSAFAKELTQVIQGEAIYDQARFRGVVLRPETARLAKQNPRGIELMKLNRMLLEDAYPAELSKMASAGWVVRDGAMASTGSGRGVIYTAQDFTRFRLMFTMRHVSGNPDHQACVLIFCSRPKEGEKPLDALGAIQFQTPNGGRWDYRPGMNNNGGTLFTPLTKTKFDVHEWSRVEIVADATKGTARMTVAQPVGSTPVDMLAFEDPAAGKTGPIAWQMHNAGLFDEFKDASVEVLG